MKISELNLTYDEKRLIASMLNRFTDIGAFIDDETLHLVTMSLEEIASMLKEKREFMVSKAQHMADNILEEIEKSLSLELE